MRAGFLVALGLVGALPAVSKRGRPEMGRSREYRPQPDDEGARLLDALGWQRASLDDVVARTGLSPARAGLGLERLARDGWITGHAGWWEQIARPDR